MSKYKDFIENGEVLHDIAAIDHISKNIKDIKEHLTDDQLQRIGYEFMKYLKEQQGGMFLINCNFEEWEENKQEYYPGVTKRIDIDVFSVSPYRWMEFKQTFEGDVIGD